MIYSGHAKCNIRINENGKHEKVLEWAKDIFFFSPADSSLLRSIALQDPLNCGTAIYDARIMMGINVNDFSTTSHSSSRMAYTGVENEADIAVKGKMYPNPSMNEAWYETTLENGQSGTVIITDMHGRELINKPLTEGNNKVRFDVSNLMNGMYLYKVIVNGTPVQNNKLIIQR